jgi:hypothetical protein
MFNVMKAGKSAPQDEQIYVLDQSAYVFGDKIASKVNNQDADEPYEYFADSGKWLESDLNEYPDVTVGTPKGMTLKLDIKPKATGNGSFMNVESVDLKTRKYTTEEYVEQAADLDSILIVLSYDHLLSLVQGVTLVEDDDTNWEDDEEEEEEVKAPKKKSSKKSEPEDDDDFDEEPVKKPEKKAAKKKSEPVEEDDDDFDSDDEDEEPVKKPAKKAAKKFEPEDDDDFDEEPVKKPAKKSIKEVPFDDDDDDDFDEEPVKKPAKKSSKKKSEPVKTGNSNVDDWDDDDDF